MTKSSKAPTEKQLAARKAFGEAARERAAKLKEVKAQELQAQQIKSNPPNVQNADVGELLRRIEELERNRQEPTGVQATSQGLLGTFEKYALDPARYPSPVERLTDEARLKRFAFKDNYELEYVIGVSGYKTIDGINTREPMFTLTLIRIMYDEDTGEKTDGRYVVSRFLFHEDPEAAIIIAREQGLDNNLVDQMGEEKFLNEMRYLRMRDWLLEAFYPAPPAQPKFNMTERVIGNRLVEFYEINSENAEEIPFSNLSKPS